MATQISGRGGRRDGAGRPGSSEPATPVKVGQTAQMIAGELSVKLGVTRRQIFENAVYEYCQKHDPERWAEFAEAL